MFAIAFDLVVADVRGHCAKGISAAYTEIAKSLAPFGFERVQGSVYLTRNPDLGNLMAAILALKALPRFPKSALASWREKPSPSSWTAILDSPPARSL